MWSATVVGVSEWSVDGISLVLNNWITRSRAIRVGRTVLESSRWLEGRKEGGGGGRNREERKREGTSRVKD